MTTGPNRRGGAQLGLATFLRGRSERLDVPGDDTGPYFTALVLSQPLAKFNSVYTGFVEIVIAMGQVEYTTTL